MAKKDNAYFDDFIKMIGLSCDAARYLNDYMKAFDPDTLESQQAAMHEIEHEEDMVKHAMMNRLVKEFVPPIDREDIVTLSHDLDHVTDKIEDILIHMYMYDIKEIRPDVLEFTDVIVRCCEALREAMIEFPHFKKSKIMAQKIIDVNTMENDGDAIYMKAVRNLYKSGASPIDTFIWSRLYDLFEDCCDACENVADELESIVMKNS